MHRQRSAPHGTPARRGRPRPATPRPAAGAVVTPSRLTAAGGLLLLLLTGCGAERDAGSAPAAAAVDWRATTYELTCDGLVPGGFRAPVVDGAARVPADGSRPPWYEFYDVRVVDTATGDVDGTGGEDTVVLLECSPQPSNGIVQEVLVFSATGSRIGSLPSPRTLQGQAPLPPVYEPDGLSVEDRVIVARMLAYAPTDSHADGPSVPVTVRWRFDRDAVVRVSAS
ncbi:hypothetical protein JKP75_10030 [Blastococcus sp. TML/M2B]|uniref:hypothetical protein n=1 Tax=unclassified Blastococcus TaxID=2619396 RepID=UPI00190B0DB9|nr:MULTISPECIES: hypothetical protein [unclassified Blastococcus]MBN1092867.1 hypothetical protein [Blastococcus sp. TML/M2B]MBN1097025.1 hypothetical protein [Blastococcus sp. TML/C7B]